MNYHKKLKEIFIDRVKEYLKQCPIKTEKQDYIEDNKNTDYLDCLTKSEYKQLEVFNSVQTFNKTFEKLKNKDKHFTKKDALWAVYNDLRLKYEYKKDTTMLAIVFERQTDILISDKKYIQALETFSAALYMYLYYYEYSTKEINLFNRHFNIGRRNKINDLLERTNVSLEMFKKEFELYIQDNIPSLYDEEKAKVIIKNIIKRIKK